MISAQSVRAEATALGFAACGIADLSESRFAGALDDWLGRGYGGTMRYLNRQATKRKRPAEIVPGAIRAVVVLENYYAPPVAAAVTAKPTVEISKYARGRDYHLEVAERLKSLAQFLRRGGATIARGFVDAGPVPERELAARAGLGWIGKNTMLIRPGAGSYFFIACVLTDLPLAVDRARVLDATRCISYLTIEYRGDVPAQLIGRLDGWALGCDICNDVCPWNERFAAPGGPAAYQDRAAINAGDPEFFERLSEAEFDERFSDTPLERPGLEGMRRNFRNAFASLETAT
jgi:epoxyqueuosine reductase